VITEGKKAMVCVDHGSHVGQLSLSLLIEYTKYNQFSFCFLNT